MEYINDINFYSTFIFIFLLKYAFVKYALSLVLHEFQYPHISSLFYPPFIIIENLTFRSLSRRYFFLHLKISLDFLFLYISLAKIFFRNFLFKISLYSKLFHLVHKWRNIREFTLSIMMVHNIFYILYSILLYQEQNTFLNIK